MKRFHLLAVLAALSLAAAASARADEIHVPSNKLGTLRNRFPFDARFASEWRYQLVIPPSYLGGQPFDVRDIAFQPYEAGTFTASRFEVRMSHTTVQASTVFAANLPSPITVLSTQNFRWNTTHQQWSPIRLPGTFTYDGRSGLCIEVRYRGGAWTRFTGTCYGSWPIHHRVWQYGAGAYGATSGTLDQAGLHVRLTVDKARIEPSGTPLPGHTIGFHLYAPNGGGAYYQVGSSLGQGPMPIGQRKLPLSPDPLLAASVGNTLPGTFRKYRGQLDATGWTRARMSIPNRAFLKGVRFYTAFVTFDPSSPLGVGQISSNLPVTIQ